jgi:DNA-binding response OmpR family regulator
MDFGGLENHASQRKEGLIGTNEQNEGICMNKKRIMLVDDDASFTGMLKVALRDFDVCVENNPLHAVETALRFKPDLIFLDVVMPGADGGTVAARLKGEPLLSTIPIVFLTSLVTRKRAAAMKEISGYEMIAKPVPLKRIIDCIRKHLRA